MLPPASFRDFTPRSVNGILLDKPNYLEVARQVRSGTSDRVFVDESFVLPSPPAQDGAVAHTTHFTAVVNGAAVRGNLVSVLLVRLGTEEQQAQIAVESFILGFE